MQNSRLLEVAVVAKRLNLSDKTVTRMIERKVLTGIRTGPELKTIRIFEKSVQQHIQENMIQ